MASDDDDLAESTIADDDLPPKWTTCRANGCIGVSLGSDGKCLAHIDEAARESVLVRLRDGRAFDFARGVRFTESLLAEVLDALRDGEGRSRLGRADFRRATFEDASFDGAIFENDVHFSEVTFEGGASFDDATFESLASFYAATFGGDASFYRATFKSDVYFNGAKIEEDADFYGATFEGDAIFGGAIIGKATTFDEAVFLRARDFGPILSSRLNLDRATFFEAINIRMSGLRLSAVETTFARGARLRMRGVEIVLDGADFGGPSILDASPAPWHTAAEEGFLRWRRRLAVLHSHDALDEDAGSEVDELKSNPSEQPRLLSVRDANLGSLRLSGVDLMQTRFVGARGLAELRIEGETTFGHAPPDWRWVGWR